MINYFKIIAIVLCIIDIVFGLRVRTPSIFGRRVSLIDDSLRSAFYNYNIVPDVIDIVPVRYPSGVEVNLGNQLTPLSVKDEPSVEWPTEMGQHYTLALIDPDVPSRKKPTKREFKHWLVVNIPGVDISKGQIIAAYRGPTPSKVSKAHRYVFLVYKQPALISVSDPMVSNNTREGRIRFNIRVFAKTYDLGEPVAANFYLSEYDDYVGYLRSQSKANSKPHSESRLSIKRTKAIDWAPRKAKTPRFPQMVCISHDKYVEMQSRNSDLESNKQENKID